MERVKLSFKVHFSFWLLLACALLFRRSFLFAVYSAAMLLHEFAHYFVAKRLFYRCTKIQVSAFGAVLYGDFTEVAPKDRTLIALAGPAANLALCVVCLALWWLFPESYVFTSEFAEANVGMASVNLLPCYPLDGGRVLLGIIEKKTGYKKALSVIKTLTAVISVSLFSLFVAALFFKVKAFSLGLFAVFLFTGVFVNNDGNCYKRLSFCENYRKRLATGVEKKTLVFASRGTFGKVTARMQGGFVYCLEVVDDNMNTTAYYGVKQLDILVLKCPSDVTLDRLKEYL